MRYGLARSHYDYFSSTASNISRQLAFAGIAATWLFRPESATGLGLPVELRPVAFLFVLTLLFDLLQYFYGSGAWGFFQLKREAEAIEVAKKLNPENPKVEDAEVKDSPGWINYATFWLFFFKMTCLLWAYVLLARWLTP